MAKITLFGMNRHSEANKGLFDFVELPEGIDRDLVINNMLIKGGEYEVLYADWDFLRMQLGVISKKWYPTFEKWLEGVNMSYNPIENYDRYEETSDSESSTGNTNASDTTNANGNGSTATRKSAYDAGLTPYDDVQEASNSSSNSNSTASSTGSTERTHTAHLHGNIGVTMAAQMLEGHYAISAWNLVEHITDIFLRETIIPIS